jgi:5-methylcytosine-specific restriction endonuclease McrA
MAQHKGAIPWNKGKKGVQIVSDETRRKLSLQRMGNKYALGSVRSEEFKERLRQCFSGEKSPNWRGGKMRNKQGNTKYRHWRKKIFERDDWTCQHCGKRGVYLEAHHTHSWAHFPNERYNLENGITLCKECHKETDNYKGKNKKS